MNKTRNPSDLMNNPPHNVIFQAGYAPEIVIREYGEDGINVHIVESWQHSLNINLNVTAAKLLCAALWEYFHTLPPESEE